MKTKYSISHDRREESLEAKARWFATLSIEERLLSALEGMIFARALAEAGGVAKRTDEDAHKTFTSVRVLTLDDLLTGKKSTGRPKDKEDFKILTSLKKRKRADRRAVSTKKRQAGR